MSDLDFGQYDEPEYEPEPQYVINAHRAETIKDGIASYQIEAQPDWVPLVRKVISSDDFFDLNVGQGATVALHGLRECGFSEETIRKVIKILDEELEEVND